MSRSELIAVRESHLAAVRRMFRETDLFVFTLGLTEAWVSTADGAVFPVCPGTVAGEFHASRHIFHNFTHNEIRADFRKVIKIARRLNPGVRFMLTVSPVPLAATATAQHVLPATMYSKSVLRAVAGDIADGDELVDYFPSYVIVTSTVARGAFYEADALNIVTHGVDRVMEQFFA